MTAKGVVIDVKDGNAIVKCQRQSACESCHNCKESGVCHAELIFGEANREITVEVQNSLMAEIGSRVEVSASTAHTLLYSVMIFLLPCLLSALCFAIMNKLLVDMTLIALSMIGVFLIGFFVFAKLLNSYIKSKNTLEITKILGENDI